MVNKLYPLGRVWTVVTIRVLVNLKANQKEAFVEILEAESCEVRKRNGCRLFQVFEDVATPNRLLLYEEWQDKASFDAYRHSAEFQTMGKELFPMMVSSPESVYVAGEAFE